MLSVQKFLTFIETSIFTKRIKEIMSHDNYKELQETLIKNPEFGDLIKGSGGLRKIRWGNEQKGKRGGVRVIYYIKLEDGKIFMLYVYAKNEQEDLTKEQLKILANLRGTK